MRFEDPYHEGEKIVQQRVGEVEAGKRNARAIQDTILKGALQFIASQPMAVLGSVDAEKNVWASVLFGQPGFMTAVDPKTVEFDLHSAAFTAEDPFWSNVRENPQVGVLLLETVSRRRLRLNGNLRNVDDSHWNLEVAEAYPNCPQYIQRRQVRVELDSPVEAPSTVSRGKELEPRHLELIRKSDVFFVASAHPDRGVDASHRGGFPGFVQVMDSQTLRVPDYSGNSMFNTLGNFIINPHAGLVFIDFEHQSSLQLIGKPEIVWEADAQDDAREGTGRAWDFVVELWQETPFPSRVHEEFLDYSPHNPTVN